MTKAISKHLKGKIEKRQLKGEKRKLVQQRLERESASNVHYETMGEMGRTELDAGNYTKCQSKSVLRKANSEWNLSDNLHKDPFTEIAITHEILRDEDDAHKTIRGYVQEINYVPLMVVMYKEESMSIAKKVVQEGNGYFYLDATGSVVMKTDHSRPILYYAMVVKSFQRGNPPVPVVEYLLDHQNTYFVMRPLFSFFYTLNRMSPNHHQPKKIECDLS